MILTAFAQTQGGGLPQFDTAAFPAQIFWEAMAFLVLLYLMMKFIIPKIRKVLDARAAYIKMNLDEVVRNRQESQRLLAESQKKLDALHEKAVAVMAQADKEIAEHHATTVQQLEKDIQRKKRILRAEIEFAKQQAMKEIRNLSAEAAILAAEKLIEKKVDTDDARRIVEDAIRKIDHLKDKI